MKCDTCQNKVVKLTTNKLWCIPRQKAVETISSAILADCEKVRPQ